MGRRRKVADDALIEGAMGVFWDRGYSEASINDIERATGVNRSSIFARFGSKAGLFEWALETYISTHLDGPLIGYLNSAAHNGVEAFLTDMRDRIFRSTEGPRGCLLVNAMTGRLDYVAQALVSDYRERLRAGFLTALFESGMDKEEAEGRARVLQVAVFGIWALARTDIGVAILACEALIDEVQGWGR